MNLVFPPLHCTATGPCGNASVNDLTGMRVARLTIQTAAVTGQQRARLNGQVVVTAGAPFTVTSAVTVTDAFLAGTVGPLSMPGSQLWLGASSPPQEGILASSGNITFGSQSILNIDAPFSPGQAGEFYPQIRAKRKVGLGGLVTLFSVGCAQPRGTRYTLITAKGGISGLLSHIVHGMVEPIPQGAIIETQENDTEGTCEGPPPRWIQIRYHDSAGTVTATAVPKP